MHVCLKRLPPWSYHSPEIKLEKDTVQLKQSKKTFCAYYLLLSIQQQRFPSEVSELPYKQCRLKEYMRHFLFS